MITSDPLLRVIDVDNGAYLLQRVVTSFNANEGDKIKLFLEPSYGEYEVITVSNRFKPVEKDYPHEIEVKVKKIN